LFFKVDEHIESEAYNPINNNSNDSVNDDEKVDEPFSDE